MATEESGGRRIGWWPAAIALLVVVAIFFFARKKDATTNDPVAIASATAETTATAATTVAVLPTATASVSAPASPTAPPPEMLAQDDAGEMANVPGPSPTDHHYDADAAVLPDGNTRAKAWQLEEKLTKTRESIKTVEQRAQILEKEIADAEAAGRKDEASEKKVVLARLRARVAELRQSLEAGVDPTTPMH